MGGLQPKKNRTLPQISNLGLVFFGFFRFFSVFFGFSILANFDWFNGFLFSGSFLLIIAFIRHLQGFIGIKYVIRQFLASQDLIVDMIFE